jgi:ABC-type sugar transport system ATPase subunit
VLRDGRVVARAERGGVTREELVTAMIGRQLTVTRRTRSAPERGPVLLEVDELVSPPEVNGMSVRVRAGEIVGMAGLVGSGRTEFAGDGVRHPPGGQRHGPGERQKRHRREPAQVH